MGRFAVIFIEAALSGEFSEKSRTKADVYRLLMGRWVVYLIRLRAKVEFTEATFGR